MKELGIDTLNNEKVIIARERLNRPIDEIRDNTNKYEIKEFKQFYGMSSQLAQEKHFGGMANYRASEGKVVEIPYKGSVENVIQEILGGIRSTMSYIGAKRLKDIPKCTTFYRVNRQLNEVFGKS